MPKWPHLNEFCKINQHFKNEQKKNHDRRHHTSELSTFEEDEPVFVATDTLFLYQVELFIQPGIGHMSYKHPLELYEGTEAMYIPIQSKTLRTSEPDAEPNLSCQSPVDIWYAMLG